MQFNPSSTPENSLISHIDFLLFGDSTSLNAKYVIADRTRNINIAYDEVVSDIYKADPLHQWDDSNNSDFPIATLALTAAQDHYTMLDTALVVHRVRMKDSNGTLRTLTPVLRRQLSDSQIIATGTPNKYYKIGGAIFPVPIPDYSASAGVELQFQRGGNHFTTSDTTTAPGFNSQYHDILAISAALTYAQAHGMNNKINMLTNLKKERKNEMIEYYRTRSPDQQPQLQLKNRNIAGYAL